VYRSTFSQDVRYLVLGTSDEEGKDDGNGGVGESETCSAHGWPEASLLAEMAFNRNRRHLRGLKACYRDQQCDIGECKGNLRGVPVSASHSNDDPWELTAGVESSKKLPICNKIRQPHNGLSGGRWVHHQPGCGGCESADTGVGSQGNYQSSGPGPCWNPRAARWAPPE
jgi:hypothetical protein